MRKKFIAGNWKMFKTCEDVNRFLLDIENWKNDDKVDVGICPPYIHLAKLSEFLNKMSIKVFAQNVYFEDEGAFTGEVSVQMLKSLNVAGSIVGHSERRSIFGESDELINKKIKSLVTNSLTAIFCVGESLKEREENRAFDVVKDQLKKGLTNIAEKELANIVIAYEPIWAIGTGQVATPKEAQEMCSFIRKEIDDLYGNEASESIIIQYGGSVNDANAKELLSKEDIDGALVGGASLEWNKFEKIISYNK